MPFPFPQTTQAMLRNLLETLGTDESSVSVTFAKTKNGPLWTVYFYPDGIGAATGTVRFASAKLLDQALRSLVVDVRGAQAKRR